MFFNCDVNSIQTRIIGVAEDALNNRLFLIQEFAGDGDLTKLIIKEEYTPAWFATVASQLLGAVRYLHSKQIAQSVEPACTLT